MCNRNSCYRIVYCTVFQFKTEGILEEMMRLVNMIQLV